MKRFLAACYQQEVDRPPVWIMRQAGRYLPEYREVRERAGSFLNLCLKPELAAEATLQPLRRFPLDAAIIFSDILLPLQLLGVEIAFPENGGPKIQRPWRNPKEWATLSPPSSWAAMAPVAEALTLVRSQLPESVALIGFCGSPWTLACYLLEGQHRGEWPQAREAVYRHLDEFSHLLVTLAAAMGDYLAWQIAAGAEAVQVFDSWAGVLPADVYGNLVVPALQTLFARLEDLGAPRILYLGHGSHLLQTVVSLPCEVVSVDWRTNLSTAAITLGKAVQGNLDPAVLLSDPGTVRAVTRQMVAEAPKRGYIANLGHGIWPNTPIGNVEAFLSAVQETL